MASKPEGKTFNIKSAKGVKEDGKTQWASLGRAFVRTDLGGGALWEVHGEDEVTFSLVPNEGTTKSGGKSFQVVDKKNGEEVHGKLFVRADMSGGAYWVGQGGDEHEYVLFSREFRAGAKKAGAPPAVAPSAS